MASSTHLGEGAAALSGRLAPEDESEWEYEYSTTETETFYVTLDLSTADFTAPHKNVISNARTDYQGNRLTEAERVRLKYQGSSEDEDAPGGRRQRRDPSPPSPETARAQHEAELGAPGYDDKVQIMELHSPNPVISYRGRVYEGQWSQNVGTELLLARRQDENDGGGNDGNGSNDSNEEPLPRLRALDHGVDLLAASCARITVSQKSLEQRDPVGEQQRRRLAPDEREALTQIPKPETKPSLARVTQGNFLAKLIALKKRRGERDGVPVLVNGHVRDLWVKGSHRGRGRGRGGRRRGSGRAPRPLPRENQHHHQHHHHHHHDGTGGGGAQASSGHTAVATVSGAAPTDDVPNSTPTPLRWEDLGNDVGTSPPEFHSENSDDNGENEMEVDEEEEGSGESGFSEEGLTGDENDENDEEEDGSGMDDDQSDVADDDEESGGEGMDIDED